MPLPIITSFIFFIAQFLSRPGQESRTEASAARGARDSHAMSFEVDIGFASERGLRSANEDFVRAAMAPPEAASRGLVAAIADGVSDGGRGREAAQTTVLG